MRWEFLGQYVPLIWEATILTGVLAIASFLIGAVLGLVIAVARVLGGTDVNGVIGTFIDLIRGTPLLVQLLAWYLGPNVLGLGLSPFAAAVVGLSINAAAFLSEIIRGGILAIPRTQREAALALGLPRSFSVLRIELPQSLPAVIPALIGFFIGLVKDTSLAYVLGLYELTRTGKIISDREFRPLEIYLVIAAIYFVMCFPLSRLVGVTDARLRRTGLVTQRLSA
jgi:polar amino acid transport system permease protein